MPDVGSTKLRRIGSGGTKEGELIPEMENGMETEYPGLTDELDELCWRVKMMRESTEVESIVVTNKLRSNVTSAIGIPGESFISFTGKQLKKSKTMGRDPPPIGMM